MTTLSLTTLSLTLLFLSLFLLLIKRWFIRAKDLMNDARYARMRKAVDWKR